MPHPDTPGSSERAELAKPLRQPGQAGGLSTWASGAWAGCVGGLAVGSAWMGGLLLTGRSPWVQFNLISAMWVGDHAAYLDSFGPHTLAGLVTHLATSVLMGLMAAPILRTLPPARVLLVSFVYALVAYALMFGLVLRWANPLMVERTSLLPMTLAHALWGIVLGAVYLRLRRSSPLALRIAAS